MAMTLNDFRKKIPQLEGLDDETALNVLHEVYYPDADKARMATALGVKIKTPEPVRPQNTLMGFIGDRGLDLVKGAVAVPEAAVGVADLVTGGAAGRAAEEIGFRPREAKEILSGMQSDAYRDRQAQFQAADGIVAKTGVALTNPSLIAGAVTESLPLITTGNAVGRGVMAVAPKMASQVVAGALGEGAVAAGSTAEQVRQQTADGYLTPKQALLSAAAGVGTAVFGYAGAKAAKAMGIADVDTALVQGSMQATRDSQIGVIKRVAGGMFAEGALEELPQSVVEQMAQNIALDKPVMQDVDSAIVMGALSGAAMGGSAALLSRPKTPTEQAADTIRTNKVPEAGTLSKAVNTGIEASAKAVEATAPIAPAPSLTGFDPSTMIPENPLLAGARVREDDNNQAAMTDDAMAKLERMNANDMAVINSARFDQSKGANEISPTEVVEPAQAGDILNPKGEPFKNKAAALTASKKYGGQVVQVMEGWAVRGGNKESANVGTTASAATVAAGNGGQLGADTDLDGLEAALTKERDSTTSEIENGWINGKGRRQQTTIERAVYEAVTASVLDADAAASIVETALKEGRPDLALYAAKRAARAADSMSTTPGVSEGSPKYEPIKKNLVESKHKAQADAKSLLEKVTKVASPATTVGMASTKTGDTITIDGKPAAKVRYGRNGTPLTEGGKPFKTKLDATRHKNKYQPQTRVVKAGDGFALIDFTDKEMAAQVAAAPPVPATEPPPTDRYAAGKALTKDQRKQVLSTLVDVYKAKDAPREQKGIGPSGNERYGYVHSPDLFEKSDITGAMVRYHVTLPDGRIAHPSELFPDFTQAQIDTALIEQANAERREKDGQAHAERQADTGARASPAEADAAFMQRNRGFELRDWRTGKTRSFVHFEKDGRYYSVLNDDTAMMRRIEKAGWTRTDTLTATTKQEVLDQQQRAKDGEAAAAKAKKEDEEKAQADAERDDFTLTGRDRTADVAAARGQTDIFSAPSEEQVSTKTSEKTGNTTKTYGGYVDGDGVPVELSIVRRADGTLFRVFAKYGDGIRSEFDAGYGPGITDEQIVKAVAEPSDWEKVAAKSTADQASEKSKGDRFPSVESITVMGFERVQKDGGAFELRDSNMRVAVEPVGNGLFQASHRSAKSSPRLTEQQAVEWAANIRKDSLEIQAKSGSSFTQAEKALASKSRPDERAGDVGVVVGGGKVQYVPLADAVEAARKAIADGTKAVPFQIHDATGIRLGDTDKVLAEIAKPADDFLPEGWTKSINGYTKRPVYRMEQGGGQPFAVVTQVEGMRYEVQIRHGDKQLIVSNQTGALSEVLAKAETELTRMTQADSVTHQDPGEKAEAATPGVVTDSLKKAARNEDTKPSEMRKWLVAEIDKELLQAADRPDYDEAVKRMGEKDAISMFTGNGPLGKNSETRYITFDVPGDGKYKVRNSVRGLLEFRKNVMASQGFKDGGQKRAKPEQNDGVQGGSGGQMAAITNMIEEGDFEAARDYAEAVGIKLEDVKVPRGDMKPAWEKYLKDGTLPPAPWIPSKEWQFQDIGASSLVPESEKRSATLTRVADGSTYVATVKGYLDGSSATYALTKDGKEVGRPSSRNSFTEVMRMAEDAMPKANDKPAPSKANDTGWNMAGVGFAGKRYRGRNITLDDGREVVARIYENAGQYEDAEVKVDGVSKFRKTDRYKAEKLADDFIRTLTAKEPAKAPIKVTPQVSGNAEKFIKVAADSVDKLRQVDVERVLSETPVHFRAEVSAYIKSNRAGLSDEVDAVMADLNEPAQASQTEPKREFRNPDNLNVLHAPIEDKDWFKLKNGEEWQARQGYSGRGWSLVRAGSLHPEARNLESQSDFIRSVIEVTGQTQAAGQVVAPVEANDEPIPAVSEAQARKQFEWRNMGQKDGTKSHLLFFFESEKDKGTGAAMNRGEVSLYPGASGWKVEDGDGTSYKSLADAKKAAIDRAIPKLQDQGYILKPAQAATAILDAANVTGKERIDALKDVKKGDITPEELQAAYPAKDSATFPNTAQGAIDAFNADDSTQAVAIMAKLKLDDLKEVGGAVGFRPQIGENAKAFRERIGTVADKLTKTSREQTSREMTLHKRLTQLASDYDRAIAHRDRAIANGAEAGSSAFEGQYEGQWTTIDKGLAILENALQEESKSPDYAKVSAMVKEARPAIFDAAKPDDSVKAEAKSEISDFGEVLPGARKDAAPSLKTELSDNDIATQPLSKIWPADEYLTIDDKFASALSFAARAEIPAKPRTSYKVKNWVEKVKTVRNLAQRITSGSVTRERMAAELAKTRSLSAFADKVALLEAIDREHWPRIDSVEVYPDAYRYNADGTQTKTPLVRVSIDGRSRSFDGATSVADVVERVIAMVDTEQKQTKKMQFEVRGTESKGFGINKKGDKEYRKLKTFPTAKEAFEFIKTGYVDLVVEWEGVKDRDNVKEDDVRGTENRPRTAKDYRNGKDVTSEQFAETFGFRGGQFGNWVNQGEGRKDRQGMLNQAYDALMDLADIVGIPPKAVSLNGTLGIAFGARGSGKASAHYEPDTLVINLTKTRGAGVLAHEWFHALDNYFSHQRGGAVPMSPGMTQLDYRKANYITYKPEPLYVHKTQMSTPITKATLERYAKTTNAAGYYNPENWQLDPRHPDGVRPEVERRMAELVEALNASPMAKRAAMNDKAPEGYWSRIIERAARSFENYVISKMMERGYHNDYLANVREVGDFPRSKERYPYLLPEEVKPIAEAFDNLFATVQTKETDKGVAMFSRGNNSSAQLSKTQIQRAVDKLTLNWLKKPDIHILDSMDDAPDPVRRVWQSQDSKGARGKIEGFHYKGGVYIVADAMESGTDIIRVLFHESLGHFGLRNVFGAALDGILKQIAAARPADMRRKATQYGFDLKNDRDRMAAAEELLAEMAQDRPEIGFVQRAIAAIRTWLRENVPYFRGMELSDAEIVRNFLEPARGFVERGIRGGESIRAALAFSKAFQPVWYSALQNSIGSLNMKAAPATGWASTIDGLVKAGKVKADEVEWSGVKEWLQLQTGKVTREQVMEYLEANGVQVQEVTLGSNTPELEAELTIDDISVEPDGDKGRWYIESPTGIVNAMAASEAEAKEFGVRYFNSHIVERNRSAVRAADDSKYSQYTLPGGENYREVLLTLPEKTSADPARAEYEAWASRNGLRPNATFSEERYKRETGRDAPAPRTMTAMAGDAAQNYKSSHWDAPNVLAHIRLNDRTDADGKRVLFVEEIQSDWAQEGKKRGFKAGNSEAAAIKAEYDAAAQAVSDAHNDGGNVQAARERLARATDAYNARINDATIPTAPFIDKTDKWVALALKRVIKMAVDEGYDRVAFVNGEQSAERYDLSKHIERVILNDNASGGVGKPSMDGEFSGGTLEAYDKDGKAVIPPRRVNDAEEIADLVGKEVAQRLLDAPAKEGRSAGIGVRQRRLDGMELKVGGEGMKAFYDQIVPNATKALLKKLGGGAMETVDIGGAVSGRVQDRQNPDYKPLEQPGFTITPAMREKVAGGLPLFSRQAQGQNQTDRGTNDSVPAFDNASGDFNPDLTAWIKQARKEINGDRMSDAEYYQAVAESANSMRVDSLLQELGWRRRGSSNLSSSTYFTKTIPDPVDEDADGKEYEVRVTDHDDYHPGGTFERRYQLNFRSELAPWADLDITPEMSTADAKDLLRESLPNESPAPTNDGASVRQTDTPAFKAWFGDSKVVDADGKPLVVYHGTGEDFGGAFNTDRSGRDALSAIGSFFTKDANAANRFADGESGVVVPVYLRAENPLTPQSEWWSANDFDTEGVNDGNDFARMGRWLTGPDMARMAGVDAVQWALKYTPEQRVREAKKALRKAGFDSIAFRDREVDNSALQYAVFSPEQIKSATGNRGTFDPKDPDIRFSRAADLRKEAAGQVVELFHTATKVPGRMNWWHKTVGTMYNLAQRSPEFKRVFSAVQDFIDDTAYYADRAARLAPNILPKLETWRDVFKSPMSAIDNRAIRAPIFEGTLTWMRDESGKPVKAEDVRLAAEDLTTDQKALRLLRNDFVTDSTLRMWRGLPMEQYESIIEGSYERHMLRAGIVFTPAELKSLFKLTDGQVKLYQEFRRATDMSLTNLAISEMVKLGGQDTASMRQAALESEDVVKASAMLRDHLLELADSDAEKSKGYIDAANKIIALSDKAKNLMDKGYAPLSRFGHYTVDVVGPDGTREYFGMFESRFEAAKMAEAMAKNYPDARIERGTVSEQAYKLFAGVTPETIELFGEILGLDTQGDGTQNQAFKAFVQRATANRSAMKRLLERKGIAGFSEDAGRVLAGFVFSNGRRTAGNLHGMEMKEAAEAIPKQQGELKDHAVALVEYVQNPQEEAQGLRGLLFTQYIGGSIASAIVNMTQPLTMSLPYLSQFGGITQAGRQMARAVKDVGKTTTGDKALDAAMTAAEEKGIVSPQEVHQLQQQAAGRAALQVGDGTMAGDARAKAGNALSKTMLAWGKLFSAAEQFNRRVTFIAAYRTAVEQKIENPAKFAEDAVIETQGLYNKGNKPKWARGAIGSTLFTFKQYSVAYVEMLGRLAQSGPEGRRAALYALAILFLLSGAGGLPGADDLDDLISGLMQKLGYNFNSKSARRAFFAKHLGQAGADFVERGVSGIAGVPIDTSGRMGLGNLIPGTGLLTKKTDHTSDVAELAGPAGDLAKRAFQAGSKAMDGDLIGKDGAVTTIAPLAVRNLSQAADMAEHGMYRDARGRKVVETDQLDALSKAFGFQPNDVKRVQDATREVQQMISLNKIRETEIADQWAKALFERDKDGVQEARDALKRWNADNPESPIRISMQQINKRLANMRMSKEDRMAKTASKEIRATVRRELEAAR